MVFGEFVEVEIACTVDFLVVFRVAVAGFFVAAAFKKLHQLEEKNLSTLINSCFTYLTSLMTF